jgi:hypothetical protein
MKEQCLSGAAEMKEIKIGTGRKLKDGEEIAISSLVTPVPLPAEAIRDVKKKKALILHIMTCFAKAVRLRNAARSICKVQ